MNNQNTIGFLKSHKKYERRIALLPQELSKLVDPNSIYLEKNYGRQGTSTQARQH